MIDEPTKNNVNNSMKNNLFIYLFISSICQKDSIFLCNTTIYNGKIKKKKKKT